MGSVKTMEDKDEENPVRNSLWTLRVTVYYHRALGCDDIRSNLESLGGRGIKWT